MTNDVHEATENVTLSAKFRLSEGEFIKNRLTWEKKYFEALTSGGEDNICESGIELRRFRCKCASWTGRSSL